jgi:hypothetical protein
MKNLIFLLLISTISIGQILPTNGDSIYYGAKYCDTAGSIEDALNSWAFSGSIQDCFNPSIGMLNALWPNIAIFDSYDCCCKVASTPSLQGSWNGYVGSTCEEYLNSIDFLSIEEIVIEQNGTYYDMQGKAYKTIPRGVSFMNYNKYFKL